MASGIRISQAGVPVDKAADYQKTIDDRWPIVEFLFMGVIEIKDFVTTTAGTIVNVPIYQHNLGYLPGFRIKGISYSGFNTFNATIEGIAFSDENTIYIRAFKTAGVAAIVNVKFFLAIIDRDITKEFQAVIDTPTAEQTSSPSAYGLKVLAVPSANRMTEKNKSKYTLNTNAKSMAIQAHGVRTAETSGTYVGSIIIKHGLGYPPTYNVAKKYAVSLPADPFLGKVVIGPLGAGSGLGFSDSLNLRLRGGQSGLSGDYAFIILKDPVDTAK